MSVKLTLICDTCYAQIDGIEDLDETLRQRGWDFDPEWGHRCKACIRFEPESDPLLSLETSPAQEATGCKHCGRPIFFGRLEGRTRVALALNAEPHHCGYPVVSATMTRLGTSIIMGDYVRVGQASDTPTYAVHRCLKKDLQEMGSFPPGCGVV